MAEGKPIRIAVTGVHGFVGHHLATELTAHGHAVVGISLEPEIDPRFADILDEYVSGDLTQSFPDIGPVDAVVHLAGLALVRPSFDQPQRYLNDNSAMLTQVCEWLLAKASSARVVIVSSGAIYDGVQPLPLTEDSATAFNSPYAVSKVLNENQSAYYRGRGLDCVVARPFNHIGPGQGPGFLLPDLADALSSGSATLTVGNLTTRRDYTDVRDVARAYRLLIEQPTLVHDTYNICSGRSISGEEILAELVDALGLSGIETRTDADRLRPNDPVEIVGDSSRLTDDTGWNPSLALSETIADFLKAR